MKIFPSKEKAFLDKDFDQFKATLIFGQDSSLVLEKIKTLEKKVITNEDDTTFSKITLDYSDIEQDFSILLHELHSISLISKKKFILIENVSNSISKDLKEFLSTSKSEHFIVLKAGELPTSSSLRKFFESEKELAALPCYAPDTQQIKFLVSKLIKDKQLNLSKEVVDFITKHSGGEHSTIVTELDKIACYAESGEDLTLETIKNILSASSEKNSYDPLIKNILYGNFIDAEREFSKLNYSGVHVVAISRNIANHFIKLLKVKTQIQQGQNEKSALDSIKPPIFFKNIPDFQAGLRKYKIQELVLIINALTKLEAQCKSINIDSNLLWQKDFFSIFLPQTAIAT